MISSWFNLSRTSIRPLKLWTSPFFSSLNNVGLKTMIWRDKLPSLIFFSSSKKKKESWKGYCLGPDYISQWIIYLKVKTLNTISHWLQSNNNNMLKIVDMVVKRRTQGKCSHEKSYNESIRVMLGVMYPK